MQMVIVSGNMLLSITISITFLVIANGANLNVSIITPTGSNPVQGQTFTLACSYYPPCYMPLQWYFWNTSGTNIIWSATGLTPLGSSMKVNGACPAVSATSNCNITMTANASIDNGPWTCACNPAQKTVMVYISTPSKSLSAGEIAGIVVGCVIIIAAIVVLLVYLLIVKAKKKEEDAIVENPGSNGVPTVVSVVGIGPNGAKGVTVGVKSAPPNKGTVGTEPINIVWSKRIQGKPFVVGRPGTDGKSNNAMVVEGCTRDGTEGEAVVVAFDGQSEEEATISMNDPIDSDKAILVVEGIGDNSNKAEALVVNVSWANRVRGFAVIRMP